MHGNRLILLLSLIGIVAFADGCTLQDAQERGDLCPPERDGRAKMTAILSGSDEPITAETAVGDPVLETAFNEQWCTVDYPACIINSKDNSNTDYFCMVRCGSEEVSCFGRCVKPDQDAEYCGAHDQCVGYQTCSRDQYCENGKCKNIVKKCGEGEVKCENLASGKGTVSVCEEGGWQAQLNCDGSCSGLECGSCINGSVQCIEDEQHKGRLQSCIEGVWVDSQSCGDVSCHDQACGICLEGSPDSCMEDKVTRVGILTRCLNGQYVDTDCAGRVSCKSNLECGECRSNVTACSTTSQGVSTVTSCVEGKTEILECGDTSCNADGTVCGVCKTGAYRCQNNGNNQIGMISQCSMGAWLLPDSCPGNSSCSSDHECGECTNGDEKCEEDWMYLCVDGVWERQNECPDGASCRDAKKCGICKNGASRCSNALNVGIPSTCESGQWVNLGTYCANNYSCADEQSCGECINGHSECLNNQTRICNNGKWSDWTLCARGEGCYNEMFCKECGIRDYICTDGPNYGKFSVCPMGQYVELANCLGACTGEHSCKLCGAGEEVVLGTFSHDMGCIRLMCINEEFTYKVDFMKKCEDE